MKSSSLRKFPFVLALCALPALLLVGGCGAVTAQSVLDGSTKSMQGVTTAKMHMETTSQAAGRTLTSTSSMDVDEVVGAPEGIKMHMYGTRSGQSMDAYMIGQNTYMFFMGKWYVTQMPAMTGQFQAGLGTIEDLNTILKSAKNARITAEDNDSYTISYSMDTESIRKQEESREQLSAFQKSIGEIGQITGDVSAKISKSKKYLTEMTAKLTTSGGPYGNTQMTYTIRLVSVNVPVSVVLPPAALNAQSMPSPIAP